MPTPLDLNSGSELEFREDGTLVRRSILPGGVRLLTEDMPGTRSLTIGAWVPVGSRDETDGHFGSTHFLEHLLFKGTTSRSALDIAQAFDRAGGEHNALTSKEYTCYYGKVLDADLPMAAEIILDMITSATLDVDEFELERGVILEELARSEDNPARVAHEKIAAAVYGDHELGRPVGGTSQTITDVPRDAVWEHYQQHYRPDTLVITAAGRVNHEELRAMVLAGLGAGGWDLTPGASAAARRTTTEALVPPLGTELTVYRATEQANVIVGMPGISGPDKRRYAMAVLNSVLGGGMSSRLFQEIREKRGLAYSTYSYSSTHTDAGLFALYAGCSPARVDEVTELMVAEFEKVAHDGITADELDQARGQLRGGTVLGLEGSSSRMTRLGSAEISLGELTGINESLDLVAEVSADEVQQLAAEIASRPRSQVRVGPFTAA